MTRLGSPLIGFVVAMDEDERGSVATEYGLIADAEHARDHRRGDRFGIAVAGLFDTATAAFPGS